MCNRTVDVVLSRNYTAFKAYFLILNYLFVFMVYLPHTSATYPLEINRFIAHLSQRQSVISKPGSTSILEWRFCSEKGFEPTTFQLVAFGVGHYAIITPLCYFSLSDACSFLYSPKFFTLNNILIPNNSTGKKSGTWNRTRDLRVM